ncbi:NAD(P)H-dependent oxidoreductase [Paenibacillus segetis]|uniref:NAD(P)H dehydrogenase (Quinone) n=1 Tax=Paenibacillus segetis TaxID=1325360 RepID=A0ABQ1YDR4_9BACL|nr:NAD(P)H-dependent oxidoreductase [Paenibacillus segetis]GGH22425.1 NAD(P)H dehydrogenase (quinone) [Paenibacillus segetis]
MKVSVILGHPYDKSFNHAIAEKVTSTLARNGHEVSFHDLYQEQFNPIITPQELISDKSDDPLVQFHCNQIKEADGIVIIHPNWWGQPPAILKGWIDRVLRQEVAYTFDAGDSGGGLPIGLLKAKVGVVFNTSNTPVEREINVFGDPLERIWKSCVFDFCGLNHVIRKMYCVVADSTPEERAEWLQDSVNVINEHFPKGNI